VSIPLGWNRTVWSRIERNRAVISYSIGARRIGAVTVILSSLMVLLALLPEGAMAQGGMADPQAIAGQNLRGYTHMFIAYFIAWAIVLGWVVSIFRRLGRVEKALSE